MTFAIRSCFVLLIIILFACSVHSEEVSLEEFAARASAEYFLVNLDKGEYGSCWLMASELFRSAANKDYWEGRMGHLRKQYGDFKNRQLRFSKVMTDVEGAPKGDYLIMIYATSFAAKESAVETLTLVKEKDGKWRVSGYSIE